MRPSLTPFQFVTLFITCFIAVPISLVPNTLMKTSEQDSWVGLLGGYVLCYLLFGFMYLVYRIAEKKRDRLPHALNRTFLFLFLLFILANAAFTTRNFTEVTHNYFLTKTPPVFVSLLTLSVAVYGAWYGITSIARLSLISFILSVIALIAMPLMAFEVADPSFLFPLLSHSWLNLSYSIWQALGAFLESFYLLSLLPLVSIQPQKRAFLLTFSCLLGMLLYTIMFALDFLVFGPYLASKFVFPSVELIRYLSLGEAMERLDIMLISIWAVIMTVKVAALIWISALDAAIIFRLSDIRSTLIPISIVLLFTSEMFAGNTISFYYLYQHYWTFLVLFGYFSFLAFYVTSVRMKKDGKLSST
ncbi:GerAB/ArcD/ProY family transporter [Brevibacillus migulae]|uniref:GerAB/ArcD/ProY family transporter n=1 Tax=Brevibacillus migulae TaxID=1644114 RepID=UPI00106DF006|nr:GerAB/ArcD/ProY family transporter [Brevibacillus migulae]